MPVRRNVAKKVDHQLRALLQAQDIKDRLKQIQTENAGRQEALEDLGKRIRSDRFEHLPEDKTRAQCTVANLKQVMKRETARAKRLADQLLQREAEAEAA